MEKLFTVFEYTEDITEGGEYIPKGWRTIKPDGAKCGQREKIIAVGKTAGEAQKMCKGNMTLVANMVSAFEKMGF